MKIFPFALAALLVAGSVHAEEKPVVLKDGPGRDVATAYCGTCHSLDYPGINAPFLNRQGWEAEVNKMIKVYGAPIEPADAKVIIDYLARTYGAGG